MLPRAANRNGGERTKWLTSQWLGAKKACNKYNDGRGCSNKCPDGFEHGCDVLVGKSKNPCGARNHNRMTHDVSRHGQPHVR